MQIDWFTTVAQAVNFLVLLAILKFVLFDRIVSSIDTRREEIQSELEQAESERRRAEEQREEAESLRSEIEEGKENYLHEAKSAAEEHGRELQQEVRHEAERMRARFRASLRDQERQLVGDLVQAAAEGVSSAAERALKDLADADLGVRMVDHFCERLFDSTPEEKRELKKIWGQVAEPLVLRSNRQLCKQEQERVLGALRAAIADDHADDAEIALVHETSDDLAYGIEISGEGHTVGWSIHAYLSQIEERIQDALREEAERASEQAQEEEIEAESRQPGGEAEMEEDARQTGS